jgi:hypothetical protein
LQGLIALPQMVKKHCMSAPRRSKKNTYIVSSLESSFGDFRASFQIDRQYLSKCAHTLAGITLLAKQQTIMRHNLACQTTNYHVGSIIGRGRGGICRGLPFTASSKLMMPHHPLHTPLRVTPKESVGVHGQLEINDASSEYVQRLLWKLARLEPSTSSSLIYPGHKDSPLPQSGSDAGSSINGTTMTEAHCKEHSPLHQSLCSSCRSALVQGNAFLSPLCLCSSTLYTLSSFSTSGSAGDSLLALVHLTLVFIKGSDRQRTRCAPSV